MLIERLYSAVIDDIGGTRIAPIESTLAITTIAIMRLLRIITIAP